MGSSRTFPAVFRRGGSGDTTFEIVELVVLPKVGDEVYDEISQSRYIVHKVWFALPERCGVNEDAERKCVPQVELK